jgi:glycerol kinase
MATQVTDTGGVYFVPALSGLGAPHWDMTARGAFLGITGGTQPAHLVRAVLEAIAYQVKEVVETINASSDTPVQKLAVDGGACENNFLMQFQADILGIPVERPIMRDTTVQGIAFAAGLVVGLWNSYSELVQNRQCVRVFEPKDGKDSAHFSTWKKAVERTKDWLDT